MSATAPSSETRLLTSIGVYGEKLQRENDLFIGILAGTINPFLL